MLEQFWWGAVFLVNVPIVVVALIGAFAFVPEARHPSSAPLDFFGAVLIAGALTAATFGIVEAPKYGWFDPVTLGALGAGVVLLAAFVLWERRIPHPLIDLGIFRNRRFSAASVSLALAYSAPFGMAFLLPQFMQYVLGYGPLQTGLRLVPMTVLVVVTSVVGAWLIRRFGGRATVVGGLLSTAAGLAVLSTVDAGSGYGLMLTAIEFGGAMGIAVLGSAAAGFSQSFAATAPANLSSDDRASAAESIVVAFETASELGGPAGQGLLDTARAAFAEATSDAILVGLAIVLVGAFVAFLYLPAKPKKGDDVRERSFLRPLSRYFETTSMTRHPSRKYRGTTVDGEPERRQS